MRNTGYKPAALFQLIRVPAFMVAVPVVLLLSAPCNVMVPAFVVVTRKLILNVTRTPFPVLNVLPSVLADVRRLGTGKAANALPPR